MSRGDHWWNEPPLWAWITMIAGLVAIVVLSPLALNRPAPSPVASAPGPTSTPSDAPSQPTDAVEEPAPLPRVVVIGDSLARSAVGGGVAWPVLLDQRLPDAEVQAVTTGDAGYVTSDGEPTLTARAADADLTGADLVVLFGGRFDASGISDQVALAAQGTIAAIERRAPGTTLLVIGPLWPGGGPPAGVRNNRDVIRSAADTAGVVFVDPLADGWLLEDAGLVQEDDIHLTVAGHVAVADLVQPLVAGAAGPGGPGSP